MWFRNLAVYRLPKDWTPDPARIEEQLAAQTLQPCGGLDKESRGWISPRADGRLIHVLNRQILISLGVEQRLLPTTIVNQFARERAAQTEAQQGHRVGRKQMREIKEQVTDELLPRAFVRRRSTYAWIDPVNGWLVVDAAARARVEELLELLTRTLDDLPAKLMHTERSPAAAMTGWLAGDEAPAGFSIDRDLELRAADEGKATVRYVRHALEGAEIRGHIAAGKSATRLGLTWADRISFVLTEQLQVKRVAFLDILKEEAERGETADEQFDLDFALMSGELARLLDDMIGALGGEKATAL